MNKEQNVNVPVRGMQTDMYPGSLNGEQAYSYALNARQESEDGNQLNITNEPSTTLDVNNFPPGFKVIGKIFIKELNKTIFWLHNPTTNASEIGFVANDLSSCLPPVSVPLGSSVVCDPTFEEPIEYSTVPCQTYVTIVSDSCLGFRLDHPVVKATYKLTNKSNEVYWTDNYNPPRWMDIERPPMTALGGLDCNLLKIFPDYIVPKITAMDVLDTGSLMSGSYQFLIAYSNGLGQELSQYYSPTNPTAIWNNNKTELMAFPTTKSIKINIEDLDTEYKYINIAVGKNIQGVESFELATTLSITVPTLTYTYTGNTKDAKPISVEQIFFRQPYYIKAGTLESQDNVLLIGNLTTDEELNYQTVANNIALQWEAYSVPYNRFEAYNKGTNTANYRGYLRDEVYAFEAVFLLANGRYTDRFPIPGRMSNPSDWSPVANLDAESNAVDPCDPVVVDPRWKVYNTGSVTGTSPGYVLDNCYVGPYMYGEFGYWESTELYPNEPLIWGVLAGTPIRHHKFPDEIIIPRYNVNGADSYIFPLGVKLDPANVANAIQNSALSQAQKDNIVGIKVVRGNRSQNKSITARGMLFNVGKYKYQNDEFLYPNYCFNDINPDVFLSTEALNSVTGLYQSAAVPYSGAAIGARLHGFTPDLKNRFVFMSPDTSFTNPSIGGTLRLETVEYGKADAHIVITQDHPRYEIGTQKGVKMAVVLALTTIISFSVTLQIGDVFGIDTSMGVNLNNFMPAFTQAYDLISKLVPFEDYGYQYNAVGNYTNSMPVPNDLGLKIRGIDTAGYLSPGMLTVPGETMPINNYQRESSVYIRTTAPFIYPHEAPLNAPMDNSRFTVASLGGNIPLGQRVQRDISSYYASIKRVVPDQWGEIHSYPIVDTGSLLYLDQPFTTVFGGDTFINRFADKRKLAFFLQNTIGMPPNADIDYSQLGNVSYPTYYLSTGPLDPRISSTTMALFDAAYSMFAWLTSTTGVIVSALTGIGVPLGIIDTMICMAALFALMGDIISTLGIKKVNFDRFEDDGFFLKGIFYLFAYGIPYFFVESDVNCDYRQAGETPEKDFYPNIGENIPDYWLQEKHVPINYDNFHLYNRSYSKQNIENYFDHLPATWDPTLPNVYKHTTRIIYSEPFNLEELQNEWLIYRANNYRDYDLRNGTLIDLTALEQSKVLARYENTMSVFNAFVSVATDNKTAILGTGSLLSAPPMEYLKSEIGYAGTQNKAILNTNYGQFWVDAKRGTVMHLNSEGINDIARDGMKNWMKENLPFRILAKIPNAPIDNSYNGCGIAMVWDNRFERVIITKRDYIPLVDNMAYDEESGTYFIAAGTDVVTNTIYPDGVYVGSTSATETRMYGLDAYKDIALIPIVTDGPPYDESSFTPCCPEGYAFLNGVCIKDNTIVPTIPCPPPDPLPPYTVTTETPIKIGITLDNHTYFCNASWTIAYSPLTKSWISFYSFIPNYYIEHQNFFQSGVQSDVADATLWNHLLTNRSYQVFYNQFHPFEIEPVTKSGALDKTLTSITYRMDALRYTNEYDFKYMKYVTFNEACCYTNQQTSGELLLHIRDGSVMTDGLFAVPGTNNVSIPITQVNDTWRFNKFMDITKDPDCLTPINLLDCANTVKTTNPAAVDYSIINDMRKRQRIKSDWFKIKMKNSKHSRYKLIFKWLLNKEIKSVR